MTLESRLADYSISTCDSTYPLDRESSYKIKVDQSDLTNLDQSFFSAVQIINSAHSGNTPFVPTYKYEGEYINESHKSYAGRTLMETGIAGWLSPEDALKIYELSFYSSGDILELGTYKGLSLSVIVQALKDSDLNIACDTVDTNAETTREAEEGISDLFNILPDVSFHINNCVLFMDTAIIQKIKYGFIFVDAGHGYKNTYATAMRVGKLLVPGGFALFHDYTDGRNFSKTSYYRVYQAVNDALLVDGRFVYCGVFGCSALFRYTGE